MIDIRCRHADPTSALRHADRRCQLAVGHEGPHALLFSRAGARMIRTWVARGPVRDREAGQEQRPWARGLPLPAWDEPATVPAPVAPVTGAAATAATATTATTATTAATAATTAASAAAAATSGHSRPDTSASGVALAG